MIVKDIQYPQELKKDDLILVEFCGISLLHVENFKMVNDMCFVVLTGIHDTRRYEIMLKSLSDSNHYKLVEENEKGA